MQPFIVCQIVAVFQFLIEVRNANLRMVPADWVKISS